MRYGRELNNAGNGAADECRTVFYREVRHSGKPCVRIFRMALMKEDDELERKLPEGAVLKIRKKQKMRVVSDFALKKRKATV